MTEHTATPWREVCPPSSCLTDRFIISESEETVAEVGGKYSMLDGDIFTVVANAKFIVKAVNAHDELVAALKLAISSLYSVPKVGQLYDQQHSDTHMKAVLNLQKIIKKIEEPIG